MGRIVVLGATGYTGRLIAERLAEGPDETVLAGRSPSGLAGLAEELGGRCPTAVIDLDDRDSITRLMRPGDVLATTVGSFLHRGDIALEAAITAGAHYLDTTGEGPFVRRVFDHSGARSATGAIVTAMGFNYAPGKSPAPSRSSGKAGRPTGSTSATSSPATPRARSAAEPSHRHPVSCSRPRSPTATAGWTPNAAVPEPAPGTSTDIASPR